MGSLHAGAMNRHKMVNFRCSTEEWQKLQAAARAHGARSVGEYLRDVVFAPAPSGDRVINAALAKVTKRLQELQQLNPGARYEAL
jgi:hypothetical protein